jgi:hypothetical protein
MKNSRKEKNILSQLLDTDNDQTINAWSDLGWLTDLQPNPFFNTDYYWKVWRNKSGETLLKTIDPLLHYHFEGWKYDLDPCEEFDTNFYLRQIVFRDRNNSPLLDFIVRSKNDLLVSANPNFDANYYLDANPDVKRSKINAYKHYLTYGKNEGRRAKSIIQIQGISSDLNESFLPTAINKARNGFNFNSDIEDIKIFPPDTNEKNFKIEDNNWFPKDNFQETNKEIELNPFLWSQVNKLEVNNFVLSKINIRLSEFREKKGEQTFLKKLLANSSSSFLVVVVQVDNHNEQYLSFIILMCLRYNVVIQINDKRLKESRSTVLNGIIYADDFATKKINNALNYINVLMQQRRWAKLNLFSVLSIRTNNNEMNLNNNKILQKESKVSVIVCSSRPKLLVSNLIRFISLQQNIKMELLVALEVSGESEIAYVEKATKGLNFPVRVIPFLPQNHKVPLGLRLNHLTEQANYEILTKMDDDDFYGPNHLFDLVSEMEMFNIDLVGKPVYSFYFKNDAQNDFIYLTSQCRFFSKDYYFTGSAFAFRKSLWNSIQGFLPLQRGEDYTFRKISKELGNRVLVIPPVEYLIFRDISPHKKHSHTWNIEINKIMEEKGDILQDNVEQFVIENYGININKIN